MQQHRDAHDWILFGNSAAGRNVLSRRQMIFVTTPGGKIEVRIESTPGKA